MGQAAGEGRRLVVIRRADGGGFRGSAGGDATREGGGQRRLDDRDAARGGAGFPGALLPHNDGGSAGQAGARALAAHLVRAAAEASAQQSGVDQGTPRNRADGAGLEVLSTHGEKGGAFSNGRQDSRGADGRVRRLWMRRCLVGARVHAAAEPPARGRGVGAVPRLGAVVSIDTSWRQRVRGPGARFTTLCDRDRGAHLWQARGLRRRGKM